MVDTNREWPTGVGNQSFEVFVEQVNDSESVISNNVNINLNVDSLEIE